MRPIELVPVPEVPLSFRQFLDLSPADREAVRTVRVEPARLGRSGFGRMVVTFKSALYQRRLRAR
jgi:hypothetical protein